MKSNDEIRPYLDSLDIHSVVYPTGVKVLKTVHSCHNQEQLQVAEKMVQNYKTIYGVDTNALVCEIYIERKKEQLCFPN